MEPQTHFDPKPYFSSLSSKCLRVGFKWAPSDFEVTSEWDLGEIFVTAKSRKTKKKPHVLQFGRFVCHLYGEFLEKICLKAPSYYSGSIWTYNFSMGEPETPQFYDFGIFERALSSQNQLFVSLETQGYVKKQENM